MTQQDILQGYSFAEQERIVEGAYQLGITPDDPMFRMMATLGRYEETMIDLQARTEAMIDAWAVMIDQKLEKTTQSAEKMHYTVVSSAVRDEMKNIKPSSNTDIKVQGGWRLGTVSLVWISGGWQYLVRFIDNMECCFQLRNKSVSSSIT